MLNGVPFYANGFNAYWLMYEASDLSSRPNVSATLRQAASHGLTIARTWAFSDGVYRPLQISPGSYNEQMFKGLDFVVSEARRYGMKLILSFVNNFDDFGGKKQYVNWARRRGQNLYSSDDFFTNPLVKSFYKNHIRGGHAEEAFKLFSRMRKEGPRPTEFALSSVLSVCGSMAILDQGKQLHAYVLCVGLDQTAMILSSLINMYSKCGCILEAAKVFSLTLNDDIVSWTAMINGYAEHGLSREAIELFERIPDAGLRPDSVTFIGVLSACSHAGLLGLGSRYFDSMTEKYRIYPSKEHYGCMIDLLCRAGRLEEAERMMRDMPFEKDVVVWSSMLRASRECGDVERGRVAAEEVIRLDPECGGAHITLANMYAAGGRWREAAGVRRLMRSRGVVKEPGWSWLKVKDQVSAFVAGDRNHPRCEEVYGVLGLVYSSEELSFDEVDSNVCVFGGYGDDMVGV
ncbi:Putative pentatricopeptide repeat-containing protein [Striga hermonthica]|uniref:Pentatricopeptide repeat-containing protein n=1 Tax=Striga hermonthica TaxID=68872 RepID=A0A9N7NY71_STRHE|nr:Putative pentatricopeptide repeat-containing protein [Striga hermonthica]